MNKSIKAIGGLTVIPVRSTHDDTAEIVTQLLFGELVSIVDLHHQWVKIKMYHDNYEGWVDNKQLLKVTPDTASDIQNFKSRQQEQLLTLKTPWGIQNIICGSPILSSSATFSIDKHEFTWSNHVPKQDIKSLTDLALNYLNAPYLWGGRTLFGIDCSGFTQTIFHQIGIDLPRDASQQYSIGKQVSFHQQKPGDLAFFKSPETGNIHHVGIVLPHHEIIHAHGRVRIDQLDRKGIYNKEKEYYSHLITSINHLN